MENIKIQTLVQNGQRIHPKTVTDAVYTNSGISLTEILEQIESNHYTKSETMSKTEIETAIAEAQLGNGGDSNVDLSIFATKEELNVVNEDIEDLKDADIFKTEDLVVNSIGGINAGTDLNNLSIQEILTKLLYPYVAPSVSISTNPNGGVYEIGQDVTVNKINVSVNKKSEKISRLEVLDGSQIIASLNNEEVENGGTFNFEVDITINSNKNFQVLVADITNKVVRTNSNSFNFYHPYYYGTISEEINGENLKTLTKNVVSKGNKSYSFTCDNEYMAFAYPKSYGTLSSIIDPNGFDNIKSFTRKEVNVVCLNEQEVPYYVYVSGAVTLSNFNLKFNY